MECLLCSISHPYLFISLFSTLFLILWSIIKPIWSMDTLVIPNSLWTNWLKAKPARKNVKNSVTVQTLKEIFSYSIVIQRSNIQNLTIFKTFKIFKNAHKLYLKKKCQCSVCHQDSEKKQTCSNNMQLLYCNISVATIWKQFACNIWSNWQIQHDCCEFVTAESIKLINWYFEMFIWL